MAPTVATVAYLGLEARAVEVQMQLSLGVPKFTIVGLSDKASPKAASGFVRRLRPSDLGCRPR